MPHLPPQPDRESIPPHELEAYDLVVRTRSAYTSQDDPGKADVFYGALLNSPPLAGLLNDSARYLVSAELRGTFSDAEREWVDVVLAHELAWDAVLYGHMPDAVAAGVRPEAILAIRQGRDEDLTPEELQLATYVRRVLSGTVDAESYRALEARFGVRGAVEYTVLICRLIMTERLMRAFGLGGSERLTSEIDDRLRGLLDRTAPVPDVTARLRGYLDGIVDRPGRAASESRLE
jgi:hypothetical protein